MAADAFEMALVHGAFRRELTSAPSLIHNVEAGDTERSSTVGGHVAFMAEALHHHHAAEDAVIWPKLRARAATSEVDVTRMEDTHREIADYIERVRTVATSWSASADPRVADQLVPTLEEFGARLDEHLADEERNVVPLINDHLTLREWRQFLARGGRFLFTASEAGTGSSGLRARPPVSRGQAALPCQCAAAATHRIPAVRDAHLRRLPGQAVRLARVNLTAGLSGLASTGTNGIAISGNSAHTANATG